MATRLWAVKAAALAAILLVAGCDDDDAPGETGRVEDPIAPAAFRVEIQGAELPASGPPAVVFRVTEGEQPIENLVERIRNGPATAPWVSPPRFVLSRLDAESGDHVSYYTRPQTGRAYQLPGSSTAIPPALPSADQATFDEAPRDDTLEARLVAQGNGVYRYTFSPLPAGAQVDRSATHTVGVWMTSHPAGGGEDPSTATLNFVPAGGAPQRDEVVTLEACNRCHAPAVEAHDARLGTQVCMTCHSPQSTDPDSGNTVDFKVMIHKIHYGGELSGSPYHIVGFRPQTATDATGVHVYDREFVNDVRDCALCHQGEDASRAQRNASFAACTSCHDNLRFDASVDRECAISLHDTEPCRHRGGITAVQRCSLCHTADEPRIGVRAVHVPLREIQRRFRYEIVDVTVGDDPTTEAAETRAPTVRFRVVGPDGQPYDLAQAPEYTAPGASLTALFAWPAQEYTNEGAPPGGGPGQPLRAPIVTGTPPRLLARPVAGQAGTYEITGPQIPEVSEATMPVAAAALGLAEITTATVHLEGHPIVEGEEIPVANVQRAFALAPGAAQRERRQVVAIEKCDACHGFLSAHGRNRNDVIGVCVECHNPRATDLGRRTSTANAACAPGTAEESIDFKTLIHAVHAADIRTGPVTFCGFGGTPHTFPGTVPHGVSNCNLCHVNDSFHVPPDESPIPLDPVVATTPAVATEPRTIAVCTSCHDQVRFDAAALELPACATLPEPNSAPCRHSAGVALPVSCVVCHGQGAGIDVARVHPIQP
jgi:OmcA/MtrC family decaheme c-type cytochrome